MDLKFPFYTGEREAPVDGSLLPESRLAERDDPSGYIPDDGLKDAVNVALLLGRPLLLTGEPGTGKTQLAYSVAWELGLGDPFKFETKSTSAARDLFYTFDTIGRFHAAQTEGSRDNLDYLTYQALGKAILRAKGRQEVEQWLPSDFEHDGPRRSVVLIDEIDKAPRDFPNDILNELEGMYFRVPELGNVRIGLTQNHKQGPSLRPVLILTSNSEKHLPDAFLRRCVYYNIPFPDPREEEGARRLRRIILSRIGNLSGGGCQLLREALDFFRLLRKPGSSLEKRPATAELLDWLQALLDIGADSDTSLKANPAMMRQTLSTLVKGAQDQDQAGRLLQEWLKGS